MGMAFSIPNHQSSTVNPEKNSNKDALEGPSNCVIKDAY